jgi:hypothetical protein
VGWDWGWGVFDEKKIEGRKSRDTAPLIRELMIDCLAYLQVPVRLNRKYTTSEIKTGKLSRLNGGLSHTLIILNPLAEWLIIRVGGPLISTAYR